MCLPKSMAYENNIDQKMCGILDMPDVYLRLATSNMGPMIDNPPIPIERPKRNKRCHFVVGFVLATS